MIWDLLVGLCFLAFVWGGFVLAVQVKRYRAAWRPKLLKWRSK